MPTEPEALTQALAYLGAIVFGGGGLMGVQKFRRRNGNGVSLRDVVDELKEQGAQTRKVTHDTSKDLTREIANLSAVIAELKGMVQGCRGNIVG